MGLLGHCRDPIGKSGTCPCSTVSWQRTSASISASAKMAKDSKPLKTFTGVPLGRSAGDRSSGRRPTRTLAPGATRENGTGSYYYTQNQTLSPLVERFLAHLRDCARRQQTAQR
jgi:hypothetical protein